MKINNVSETIEYTEYEYSELEFFDCLEEFRNNNIFEKYPTIYFQNGLVEVNEMWGVNSDKKLWISSFTNGVVNFKNGSYIESYYGSEKDLGQLVSIVLTEYD